MIRTVMVFTANTPLVLIEGTLGSDHLERMEDLFAYREVKHWRDACRDVELVGCRRIEKNETVGEALENYREFIRNETIKVGDVFAFEGEFVVVVTAV